MTETENQRVRAFVSGRVQGVGFRYFVRQVARELELNGWVRNRRDGRVELLAEGPQAALEDLLGAVGRGPSGSQVTEVNPQWEAASGEFNGFGVKGTI